MRTIYSLLLTILVCSATASAQSEIAWIEHPNHDMICISPDSRYIVSGSYFDGLTIRDMATGIVVRSFADTAAVACFSSDGFSLISLTHGIKTWKISTGSVTAQIGISMSSFQPMAIAGNYAVGRNSVGTAMFLFDLATGNMVRTLQASGEITRFAFSPDGALLGRCIKPGLLQLTNVTTGDSLFAMPMLSSALAISPDKRYIATGGSDRIIKLWDLQTHALVRSMPGHTMQIYSLAFSADGNYIASVSEDGTVRLWDVASGKNVHTYSEYPSQQYNVAFSPDMRYVVSTTSDGALIAWRANYGAATGAQDAAVAGDLLLKQNMPNPVTSRTTISYVLPRSERATLRVIDLLGREIALLADEDQSAGLHSVAWDASTQPPGLYYYSLTAGNRTETRRMLVTR